MTGYLSGLLERERSGAGPGAIVPRLPSRYEPWQRAPAEAVERPEAGPTHSVELSRAAAEAVSPPGPPPGARGPATVGALRVGAADPDRALEPGHVGVAAGAGPEPANRPAAHLSSPLPSQTPAPAQSAGLPSVRLPVVMAAAAEQQPPAQRVRPVPEMPARRETVPVRGADGHSAPAGLRPAPAQEEPSSAITPIPPSSTPLVGVRVVPVPVALMPVPPREGEARAKRGSSAAGAPARPPAETVVQVTIGRIEVRAVPAPARPDLPARVPPPMSLDEYLRRRHGGRG